MFLNDTLYSQLDKEIEKLVNSGLKRREHMLELCRMMVRSETMDHRLALLNVLQVTC